MADTETGMRWWLRYVLVPVITCSAFATIVSGYVNRDEHKATPTSSPQPERPPPRAEVVEEPVRNVVKPLASLQQWAGTWKPVGTTSTDTNSNTVDESSPGGTVTVTADGSGGLRFTGGFTFNTQSIRTFGGRHVKQSYMARFSGGLMQQSSTRTDWQAVPGLFTTTNDYGKGTRAVIDLDLSQPGKLCMSFPDAEGLDGDWLELVRK